MPAGKRDNRIEAFEHFVSEVEPRLRRALVAAWGPDDGSDAAAAALAYAWEHWEEVSGMRNPAGYLYRVGRSSLRTKRQPILPRPVPTTTEPEIEPRLPQALERLSEQQRVAVLLVKGWGWTQREAAELLGVEISTVRNHITRALEKLRDDLEVEIDA